MFKLMESLLTCYERAVGYRIAAITENIAVLLSGFILGAIITLFVLSSVIVNFKRNIGPLKKIEMGNISVIRLKNEGKETILINPDNIPELMDNLIDLALLKLFPNKMIFLKNRRRANRIVWVAIGLALLFSLFGIGLAFHVIEGN
ncbi:hypothetical protein PTH_2163 [Pelotomaculum thermopropionicum SI]|uniref:Uncharacterized protein n=1 Tax=Pelotomaculum thermopropionicum (strain DSM 13744 / JCM 10971 / SI) TaxID=370438 RepID=A5D080_PELTS|nr:hypothetical protein PTH_2163 [Pelotomaculum thermopropionicum SI]